MEAPRTSQLRAPTGLDRGARIVLLDFVKRELGPSEPWKLLRLYFDGRFADIQDYSQAVQSAQGKADAVNIRNAAASAELARRDVSREVILTMPEGDFLELLELAIVVAASTRGFTSPPVQMVRAVNEICQGRGIAYKHDGERFAWVGDPEIEEEAIVPAVSVLADSRLAGARAEFETARRELTINSDSSRKQAVAEACNAVESAMKVLAAALSVNLDPKRQQAQAMFQALLAAGAVEPYLENVLTAPSRIGNPKGRHGAGETPHDVPESVANAAVAAAAVAITYLGKRLPTSS